jgi:hypothetical protein
MPAALLHFSSLRRSQHNYACGMPALKFQQNLRQNRRNQLPKVIEGLNFNYGVEVTNDTENRAA